MAERESVKQITVRVYFGRNFLHGEAKRLDSTDGTVDRKPYVRLQLKGDLWRELRATDQRKHPRMGILFDDGVQIIPMYLQGWNNDMVVFGQLMPSKYGERPQKFYEVKEV